MTWEAPGGIRPRQPQHNVPKTPKPSKMVTPAQLAACGTEDGHQSALFCWSALPGIRQAMPELEWLYAIPNGGSRHIAEATKLVATGVKSGVSDIAWPLRRRVSMASPISLLQYSGLYIELKRPDSVGKRKGITASEQTAFQEFATAQGYRCAVCYGWEDAVAVITQYYNLGA